MMQMIAGTVKNAVKLDLRDTRDDETIIDYEKKREPKPKKKESNNSTIDVTM